MMQHPDSSSQIRVGKTDVVYEHKPPSVEVPPPTLKGDLLSLLSPHTAAACEQVPPSTLQAVPLSLLTEGRHSDVTIEATCNGEAAPVTFSAHRASSASAATSSRPRFRTRCARAPRARSR